MDRKGHMTAEMAELTAATGFDERSIRRVVRAIASAIRRNDRVELRGLGVFTWRPFHGRLPDGTAFASERLWFNSCCLKRDRRNNADSR